MKSIIVLGTAIITAIFGIAWMSAKLIFRFIVVLSITKANNNEILKIII